MARTDFTSVAQYLATQPPKVRAVLRKVRAAIRAALPGAEEKISYRIPGYRYEGRMIIWFAGWKEHYSIYPATAFVVGELGDALGPYELRKGTIRFPLDRPVPVRLITRIAKLRLKESTARLAAKAGARRR
jgi:uncharacterized protein YdhG (YjbR/CyaY superfamily)